MPVGAAIGSAVVGAGGAILSSKAQKKAAGQAADASYETAQLNNQLARDIYGGNAARLDPLAARGYTAGGALMDLLGFGTPAAGTTPTPGTTPQTNPGYPSGGGTPTPTPNPAGAPSFSSVVALNNDNIKGNYHTAFDQYVAYYRAHPDQNPGITPQLIQAMANDNYAGSRDIVRGLQSAYDTRQTSALPASPYGPGATPTPTPTPTPGGTPTPGTTPAPGALSAFDRFRQSTNYTFRLGEGQHALEMSRLPGGGYDSGATRQAITEYGQNFASNELSNYMNLLAQQQQLGLGAASALAGVGQNFVGQVSANNNSAGTAAANAALVNGTANANMWGGIAGSIGQAVGALGSSYRPSSGSGGGGWFGL